MQFSLEFASSNEAPSKDFILYPFKEGREVFKMIHTKADFSKLKEVGWEVIISSPQKSALNKYGSFYVPRTK